MRWGLEAWNRPDEGTAEEWARLSALGGACLKLRCSHPLAVVDRALALWPDCLFLLRRSADGWPDPAAQVAELVPVVAHIWSQGARCIYLLDNEPNLGASSARRESLAPYRTALADLVQRLRAQMPQLPLASPPLAPMQDDLHWLAQMEPAYREWALEYRACHLYWQDDNWQSEVWGRRLVGYAALAPGQRWLVDELGDATPRRPAEERAEATGSVLRWLQRRDDVEAATVFIAGGTIEWEHYWLPAAALATIRERLRQEQQAQPKEGTVVDESKSQILASIDTLWGVAEAIEAQVEELRGQAQRIRDYVVLIKQAAGLEGDGDPKVPSP